jgi:hypothetical protein
MFFFRSFILCSALVSSLVIVLSDSPVKESGNGETCPILEKDIVGKRLAGTSVIKTATLLDVSRATVSEVMSAYTNHGKT